MGNETVPTNHGFLDGCYLHEDAYHGAATLVSFHFVRYILFTVMLTIAGPLVYRIVAAFFDLERDFKSVADHFDDVTSGLLYSYVVFTLGNYAHTFGWVTLVFYFVGLLAYSALVELPFMRVSLPGWRDWSKGAWAVNLTGVALVLVAAGFHIRWSYKAGILQWYLPLFVLATASVWSTIFVRMLHHHCIDNCPEGLGIERRTRKVALVLFTRRSAYEKRKRQAEIREQQRELRERAERYAATTASAPAAPAFSSLQSSSSNNGAENISLDTIDGKTCDSGATSEIANALGTNSTSLLNMPNEPTRQERINTLTHAQKREVIEEKLKNRHYLNVQSGGPLPLHRYRLHLHHWQIFYILAFFTRFDEFASRACAGIVLGIVTQGSAAYGFDAMMERKGEYHHC
ncbi:hypothetical protein GQ54DRAFT_296891 [Martensiomyces pterosporus]|nr:hypothetical protein GQ54DRAFT_296891 [Martensiomyces pterosporus]